MEAASKLAIGFDGDFRRESGIDDFWILGREVVEGGIAFGEVSVHPVIERGVKGKGFFERAGCWIAIRAGGQEGEARNEYN